MKFECLGREISEEINEKIIMEKKAETEQKILYSASNFSMFTSSSFLIFYFSFWSPSHNIVSNNGTCSGAVKGMAGQAELYLIIV